MSAQRRGSTARNEPRPARGAAGASRRASLSMDAVISEAVVLLDEAGESALTFRALASRLGGGAASIYWYVSGRDELLDRAADHVFAGVLKDPQRFTGRQDPIDDLRAIALVVYDAVHDRPWLAAYFTRDGDQPDVSLQPNVLALYELLGEQVLRLGLPPRESFHAVSAVVGFVIGVAADFGQQTPPEVLDGTIDREEYMAKFVDQWRALDPAKFPFVHYVIDEFAGHDDREQFAAGLDLLLEGLRLQASR